MPRFKSKHRSRPTCRFSIGAFGLGADRRHIRLPVIGAVRTAESTRKLTWKVETGTARIRSATLSWQRGRWHMSFSVETPDVEPAPRDGAGSSVWTSGSPTSPCCPPASTCPTRADSTSPCTTCAEPSAPACAVAARTGCTRVEPSNRWRKARARANRIHTQVAAQRRDHLHKLTTRLVAEHDTIVIEDLAVANMLRNRSLARHIAGASWAELRRQLEYKSTRASVRLVVADRWFASSKTCSGCGTAKVKLALSERTYMCMACGLVLDRDHNAARNLAALAADTGELRRELPDGSDARPVVRARPAVAPSREELTTTQRRLREEAAR